MYFELDIYDDPDSKIPTKTLDLFNYTAYRSVVTNELFLVSYDAEEDIFMAYRVDNLNEGLIGDAGPLRKTFTERFEHLTVPRTFKYGLSRFSMLSKIELRDVLNRSFRFNTYDVDEDSLELFGSYEKAELTT